MLKYLGFITTIMLIAGLGTHCTPRRQSMDQCVFNADCASGLICAAGQCRQQCQVDRDCVNNFLCRNSDQPDQKVCVDPNDSNPPCLFTSDCPTPKVCSFGRCVFQCQNNYDCQLFGATAYCVIPSGSQGGTCSNNPRLPLIDVVIPPDSECVPGNSQSCNPPVCSGSDAACVSGIQYCTTGGTWGPCLGGRLTGICTPGQSQPCMRCVGNDAGMCSNGRQYCTQVGTWSDCVQDPMQMCMNGCELTGITHFAMASDFACAIDVTQSIYCWGAFFSRASNSARLAFPKERATQIAAGDRHVCWLRTTGEVLCVGSNSAGQTGSPAIGSIVENPFTVTGLPSGITRIFAGGDHTCATNDTAVYCWGANRSSEIAPGASTMPTPVAIMTASPLTGVEDVAVGVENICVLSGGTISCRGGNFRGQLCTPDMMQNSVTIAHGTGQGTDIELGGSPMDGSRLFITTDMFEVHCCGANGQLQISSNANIPQHSTPYIGAGLPGDGLFALGAAHTCYLAGTTIGCYGRNNEGQTGQLESPTPQSEPMSVDLGGARAIDLQANGNFTCALLEDSRVMCWGSNMLGQIGINQQTPTISSPSFVRRQ